MHARADQSHLLRRGVTEHVTSVHLVRVPTASRCQPHRSRTGRDACPSLIVYPNETKRSDRTGRLETSPPRSPSSPSPSFPISRFHESFCSRSTLCNPFFPHFLPHFLSSIRPRIEIQRNSKNSTGERDERGGTGARKYDRGEKLQGI